MEAASIMQALIEIFYNDTKKPGNSTFPGFFHALNFLFVFAKSDRKTVVNEEKKIAALIDFIGAMEVREDDEEFQNPVDIMFENMEKKNPKHFSVR